MRSFVTCILVVVLLISISAPSNTVADNLVEVSSQVTSQISYRPIYINSDADFEQGGFPGSGTQADPYIIENREIRTGSPCIVIAFTTAHFTIRNCKFESTSSQRDTAPAPVLLYESQNGVMEDCEVVGGIYGIFLYACTNHTVRRCFVSQSSMVSIYHYSSINCTLRDNSFDQGGIVTHHISTPSVPSNLVIDNCTIDGKIIGFFHDIENITIDGNAHSQILLDDCYNVTIRNFDVANVTAAIQMIDSGNCSLSSSHISALGIASVYIMNCMNLSLRNNIFEGKGLTIEGGLGKNYIHTISNNTIDGKEIQYRISEADFSIEDQEIGQIFLVNCTNAQISNVKSKPVTCSILAVFSTNVRLVNVSIGPSFDVVMVFGQSTGIQLANCSISSTISLNTIDEFEMTGCDIVSSSYGCILQDVTSFLVQDNSFFTESWAIHCPDISDGTMIGNAFSGYGLSISYGENVDVVDNLFENCDCAIGMIGYAITISSNKFIDCQYGIYAQSCDFITIEDIRFIDMVGAIECIFCNNTEVKNCSFHGCANAIFLSECTYNSISDCFIENAGVVALNCINCSETEILDVSIIGAFGVGMIFDGGSSSSIWRCNISSCIVGMKLQHLNGINVDISSFSENQANGIATIDCEEIIINQCNISFNGNDGIELADTGDSRITRCEFANNSRYGIEIMGDSHGTEIYYNIFFQNGQGNAYDCSGGNFWDDGDARGNYWDDWVGSGYYAIPGSDDAIDHFPMKIVPEDTMGALLPTAIAMIAILVTISTVVLYQKRRTSA